MGQEFFSQFAFARSGDGDRADNALDKGKLSEAGFEQLGAEREELDFEVAQDLAGDAVGFTEEAEEEMFRGEGFLLKEGGFDGSVLERLICTRGKRGRGSVGWAWDGLDEALNFGADLVCRSALGLQGASGKRIGAGDEGEKKVFGADEMVIEGAGLFFGEV
jgi:hypothetical protein